MAFTSAPATKDCRWGPRRGKGDGMNGRCPGSHEREQGHAGSEIELQNRAVLRLSDSARASNLHARQSQRCEVILLWNPGTRPTPPQCMEGFFNVIVKERCGQYASGRPADECPHSLGV